MQHLFEPQIPKMLSESKNADAHLNSYETSLVTYTTCIQDTAHLWLLLTMPITNYAYTSALMQSDGTQHNIGVCTNLTVLIVNMTV